MGLMVWRHQAQVPADTRHAAILEGIVVAIRDAMMMALNGELVGVL